MSVFLKPDNKASNIGRFAGGVIKATTKIPDLYAIKYFFEARVYLPSQFLFDDMQWNGLLLQDHKRELLLDYRICRR